MTFSIHRATRLQRRRNLLLRTSLLFFAGSLVAAFGLTGCETVSTAPERGGENIQTKNVLPVPASRAGQGDGAVLLIAELKGTGLANDAACRWRFINTENKKSYFVNVKAGQNTVFEKLDPGTYKTGRLGCGISKVWDLDDVFKEGFRIEAGQISYIGRLSLEFKNGNLDTVRKVPRADSAQAFTQAASSINPEGMTYISGFTGKPIDRKMIESGENLEGFDVYAKGISDPQKTLEPLINSLKTCAKDEGVADPLRFGRLEYTALYKQGRFAEMKDRQEANGFSDRLRSCVERGIMAYHPPAKTDIEVRVRY